MSNPEFPSTPEAPSYSAPVPPVTPPAPYGAAPQPGAQAPMNTLALVAFIGSFFVGLVGIICGHISLKQIKRDGTRGRGFALAGTIIGYVATIGWIIGIILLIVGSIAAAGLASNSYDSLGDDSGTTTTEEDPWADTDTSTETETGGATDFCGVLDEITTKSMSDDVTNADFADAYSRLSMYAPSAAGADLYAQLSEYSLDPASLMSDPSFDPETFQSEVQAQLATDAATC